MDTISDMLTRIRNAVQAKKEVVEIPSSRMKKEIARVLKEEGYIANFKIFEDGKAGTLKILLRYTREKEPAITRIERVSKPSRRIYRSYQEADGGAQELGTVILSTSKGIVTSRQAKTLKVGGEILAKVW
ncbi:MAG: 30S ribosomal protein S8 [Elusimicrobia bacterium]|nr:30S ribosomal protein S8 [Elusimicrobiota bacterium]